MASKEWNEVLQKFKEIKFQENFDLIVAIANGGVIPAAILNQSLQIPLELIHINLRDVNQKPKFESPQLIEPLLFEFSGRKILLVEDRVKTGASLNFAKSLLKEAAIIRTFAVNGQADYSLYNETCFRFPWII